MDAETLVNKAYEITQAGIDRGLERAGLTAERWAEELASIALSDITDYVNGDWSLKAASDIPKLHTRVIESVEDTANGKKIKLHSKLNALQKIGEAKGWSGKQKVEHSINADMQAFLESYKKSTKERDIDWRSTNCQEEKSPCSY